MVLRECRSVFHLCFILYAVFHFYARDTNSPKMCCGHDLAKTIAVVQIFLIQSGFPTVLLSATYQDSLERDLEVSIRESVTHRIHCTVNIAQPITEAV